MYDILFFCFDFLKFCILSAMVDCLENEHTDLQKATRDKREEVEMLRQQIEYFDPTQRISRASRIAQRRSERKQKLKQHTNLQFFT